MCMGGGGSTPTPEKPQDAKMPEQAASGVDGSMSDARKKAAQSGGSMASTLLTGPSGVENSQLRLGRTTLLGA